MKDLGKGKATVWIPCISRRISEAVGATTTGAVHGRRNDVSIANGRSVTHAFVGTMRVASGRSHRAAGGRVLCGNLNSHHTEPQTHGESAAARRLAQAETDDGCGNSDRETPFLQPLPFPGASAATCSVAVDLYAFGAGKLTPSPTSTDSRTRGQKPRPIEIRAVGSVRLAPSTSVPRKNKRRAPVPSVTAKFFLRPSSHW